MGMRVVLCPVCNNKIVDSVKVCTSCEIPHHEECWKYNGGKCGIYGCGSTAARDSDEWDEIFPGVDRYPEPPSPTAGRRPFLVVAAVVILSLCAVFGFWLIAVAEASSLKAISMNNLAYEYAEKGERLDEAYYLVRHALKQTPDNPCFLDTMGWVLYKQGKFQEAAPYFSDSMKLHQDSNEPEMAEHTALAKRHLKATLEKCESFGIVKQ